MRLERWMYVVPLRLRSVLRRERVERELDDELRYHIEQLMAHHKARGMTADEARHAAQVAAHDAADHGPTQLSVPSP